MGVYTIGHLPLWGFYLVFVIIGAAIGIGGLLASRDRSHSGQRTGTKQFDEFSSGDILILHDDILWRLDFLMHLMAFDKDGRERTGRTQILASATTDTAALVDSGNEGRLVVFLIQLHHLYRTYRTMAGTVATLHPIVHRHTVFLDKHGMTNLDGRFLVERDRLDGTGGTNLSTSRAFWSAIAALIRHGGLHQFHQVGRGP